jgi:hypothetical protein
MHRVQEQPCHMPSSFLQVLLCMMQNRRGQVGSKPAAAAGLHEWKKRTHLSVCGCRSRHGCTHPVLQGTR